MRFLKFIDRPYHIELLAGRIRLQSLHHFAALEERTGDQTIGDRMEAGSEVVLKAFHSKQPAPGVREELQRRGLVEYTDNATVIIENLVVKEFVPHSLIFCVTSGSMEEEAKIFDSDAVVRVTDLEGLARAIMEGTLVNEPAIRCAEIFSKSRWGKVSYSKKTAPMGVGFEPASGPFAKPEIYCGQKEYRLVFLAQSPFLHDRIDVQIERPERFFRLETFEREVPRREVLPKRPLLDALGSGLIARRARWPRGRWRTGRRSGIDRSGWRRDASP